jgi:hypothetical protein
VKYGVKMASDGMVHIPSFMTIGLGIHVTLKLIFRKLETFSVGITDGNIYEIGRRGDFWWHGIYTKFHEFR